MSRGWELAKIGIDVASYFLVTIDLYGEDRVERLTKWLAQRMAFLKDYLRLVTSNETIDIPPVQPDGGHSGTPGQSTRPLSSVPRVNVAALLTAVSLLILRLLTVVYPVALVAVWITLGVSNLALFLLRRVQAKGLMLLTGTLLLLIEKAVDAYLLIRSS